MDEVIKAKRQSNAGSGTRAITVRGAREHNLKNVDLEIPRDRLVVFTGLSGSGKSSLAFDTIYAEGQRRYVESLSAYEFLEMMQKPDVDQIDGLSPAISIEQKTTSKNPRSTVGTVTEIYDYMRLLWARVGGALLAGHRPSDRKPDRGRRWVDRVLALPEGTRLYLLGPVVRGRKGEYRKEMRNISRRVFSGSRSTAPFTNWRKHQHSTRNPARHRRGGRPHRGALGHRPAAGGELETALKLAEGLGGDRICRGAGVGRRR